MGNRRIISKDVLAQSPQSEETTRAPMEEQTLSEEELEELLEKGDDYDETTTNIEHYYATYGEPDRLRVVSAEGRLFDVFPMPDGKIAVEPVTLKVEYNPSKIRKYNDWEEVQAALDQVTGGFEPYKAINALRRLFAHLLDDGPKNNPYD